MQYVVCGLSYKTSGVELRQKLALSPVQLADTARQLRQAGLDEAFVVSTCNRVEVYSVGPEGVGERAIPETLSAMSGVRLKTLSGALYAHKGEAAINHLFRVASSLDSLVVGEAQILGQMRAAYHVCREADQTGPSINRAVQRAFRVAKLVRNRTAIGEGRVSISSVAVERASHIFESFADKVVLLVGAGEMGELAARHFKAKGARQLRIINRSRDRADRLASRLDGVSRDWSELEVELATADIVVVATGATEPIITYKMMKRVVRARRHRTLVLLDISVPLNVEGKCRKLDNVWHFDVDDLEACAQDNLASRQSEADVAERFVRLEALNFHRLATHSMLQPALSNVSKWAADVRRSELARLKCLDELTDVQREAVLLMVHRLSGKLLHPLLTGVKIAARQNDVEGILRTALSLGQPADEK